MLVYYCIIFQSLSMTFCFTSLGLGDVYYMSTGKFNIWRTVLETPSFFCLLSTIMVLTLYNMLLAQLLKYQRLARAQLVAVYIDNLFQLQRLTVFKMKILWFFIVLMISVVNIVYPLFMLAHSDKYMQSTVTKVLRWVRFGRAIFILVIFLTSTVILYREIKTGYHDLKKAFFWRLTSIGLAVAFCNIALIYLDIVLLKTPD